LQYLFNAQDLIYSRLKSIAHLFLFSDYDGTLVPIAARPELAVLPPRRRELLQKLSRLSGLTLGIISGRQLDEIKNLVQLEGIFYAGNHGLELEGPGLSLLYPEARATKPIIDQVASHLSEMLASINGVIVENKGLTLSLHYRLVSEAQVGVVEETFYHITRPLEEVGKVKVTQGKKVWEVRPPVDWDKGKAINLLLTQCQEHPERKEILPIYLGDDVTDEDGFRAVAEYGGWGIFVGAKKPASQASYFLLSCQEVDRLLALVLLMRQ